MKNSSLVFLTILTATVSSLSVGCSDGSKKNPNPVVGTAENRPTEAAAPKSGQIDTVPPQPGSTVSPTALTSSDPFAAMARALDNATRETTASLATAETAMNLALDAHIAQEKSRGATSTTVTESQLGLARTDFTQKVRALSLAGAETWANAQREAEASLQNLRQIYAGYLTEKAAN